jgi:RNA polymerase sigma-70 factor (ECF subfamily)
MREEELLAHGDFIKRLARRLVPDEFWASDVAQQTFAAALEFPPPEEKPLGPWLAVVTRNFARKLFIRESMRKAKERRAAPKEQMPSTDSVVEREEIRRKVVNAVLGLDEPYRSTLLLRFYEELQPREVARRMDAPVETVRTRVKRGLEQLRGKLDHLYGDRSQWCLALAPFTAMKASLKTAAAVSMVKLAAAVLLVTGMSFTLYWMWPEKEMTVPDRITSAVAMEEIEESPAPPMQTDIEIEADPVDKVALAPAGNRVLEGVVIHQDTKQRLPGLNLWVFEHTGSNRYPADFLEAITGPDGRFEVAGIPWQDCDILLHDEDYHCRFNKHVSFKKTDRPDAVVLEAIPGTYLLIRVLDADGDPAPFARLAIGKKQGGSISSSTGYACNDQGHFFLNHDMKEGTTVAVVARGATTTELSRVGYARPTKGDVNEITLQLRGGPPVGGRVVGPDGRPLPGVRVRPRVLCAEESGFETLHIPEHINPLDFKKPVKDEVFTDEDGHLLARGLAPGRYRFATHPEEYDEAFVDVEVGEGGVHRPEDIILQLRRARLVKGRVVDVTGVPVTGSMDACAMFYHTVAATLEKYKHAFSCDFKDGTFRFPSNRLMTNVELAPEDRLDFVIAAPGFVPFIMRDAVPSEEEIRVELKRGAAVSGHVVSTSDAAPIPAFRFTLDDRKYILHRDVFSYTSIFGNPFIQRFEDPDGRFTVTGLEPGSNELLVEADGYTSERIEVTAPCFKAIEVALRPCLMMKGRVVRSGTDEALIRMKVSAHADGASEEAGSMTDASGNFELNSLAPGSYQLRVSTGELDSEFHAFGPFEVRPGVKQEEVILRVDAAPGIVVVRVLDQDDRPVVDGARVQCMRPPELEDGSVGVQGVPDDMGIARLEGIRPGMRLLTVRVEQGFRTWWVRREIEVLAHGETPVTVRQPGSAGGATIRGKVLKQGVPRPRTDILFRSVEDGSRSEKVVADPEGNYSFHGVEPGTYEIRGPARNGVTITVEQGDRLIVEDLRLDACRITGTIRTSDERPMANALGTWVTCYDEASGFPVNSGSAGEEGRFTIEHLAEGRYSLYAWSRIGDAIYAGLLRHVTARDADPVRSVPLVLQPACELCIAVPEDGHDVRLFYRLEGNAEFAVRGWISLREKTERGWLYRNRMLVPGVYRIEFHLPSGRVISEYVELKSGEVKRVDSP